MASIWVYPGQGVQRSNMLHDMPQTALVKEYLERASDVLKEDVLLLDSSAALQSTRSVQLCLLISGVVSSALLTAENLKPDYVAGLSIGAWSAAVVAGVLVYEDAIRLVAYRGELMQNAYPRGYGMTALIGTDRTSVEKWVKQIYQITPEVYVANINAHNQIVISGSHEAMRQVVILAKQHGVIEKKLDVSVPSHCELLSQQAEQLAASMEGVTLKQPKIRYLSGTTARTLAKPEQIGDDLAFNMSRTVDWESTIQAAWERGVRLQIEALPGTVLTTLARRTFKEGTVLSLQGTRIDSIRMAMQKQQENQIHMGI
ncbi:malonate decarboxylase subunit epsilon [Acinetobacter genomosp. 15BJ]|uniref:Malonyl CoA-acyl carrier protein transacylase n=1 Tax=Acinetobacter genomosp. 15BJ TaxID=106651 RepID=R9B778_9GAMM|nr:malonate decarboxylase subunit epsilon [Acinetobacter genomosp. 15BJ]EOR10135.1 malonate decarboxylase, epsilon subunit [Acinetobacter genomosp. 15BJ]MCH7290312.1 malonate decarboxylase subunit epsilon [Acinetobacter genomosp. 15BJ]MDO3658553.1 malonate decarboxylase subunit epsilon [Acinetobacter genomosp. 15BJ]